MRNLYLVMVVKGGMLLKLETFLTPGEAIHVADDICRGFESDSIYPLTEVKMEKGPCSENIIYFSAYSDGVDSEPVTVIAYSAEVSIN